MLTLHSSLVRTLVPSRISGLHWMLIWAWMKERLQECHRVLQATGSLFLHCDQNASHYLKVLLDDLFGRSMFRNEIVWSYRTGGVSKRCWPKKHDLIFWYSRTDDYVFHPQQELIQYEKPFFNNGSANVYVRDVWDDIKPLLNFSAERTGWPTQKPVALLDRIVRASTNEGQIVLDPFCGSGTSLVSAKKLNRRWIGIDQSVEAVALAEARLASTSTEAGLPGLPALVVA